MMEIVELANGNMLWVHGEDECHVTPCAIHSPSEHEFRKYGWGWNGRHVLRITPTGPVIDPDDYEYNRTGTAIVRNSAVCRACGTELESKHVHDYVSCPCGNVVDGGPDYLRRAGVNLRDTSIIATKEED